MLLANILVRKTSRKLPKSKWTQNNQQIPERCKTIGEWQPGKQKKTFHHKLTHDMELLIRKMWHFIFCLEWDTTMRTVPVNRKSCNCLPSTVFE
jgi:hypothetical protein